MKLKVVICFMFLMLGFINCENAPKERILYLDTIKEDNSMDVTDFSVYYDVQTNKTIKRMLPRPWYKPGWLLRLPFRGGPCQCEQLKCKCCTGVRIQSFNFDRRTRNPPPFCIPIPVPYLPPGLMDMCIRLFDVSIVDQKLHVCMDMDTRIDKAPVVILHFDCMDMGAGGVGLSKPGGAQPALQAEPQTTTEQVQLNADVYDPITDNVETTKKPLFGNSIKYT